MKNALLLKLTTLLFVALIAHLPLAAQKLTEEKLIGCWKIKSIEFLQTNPDSAALTNSTKGIITCFEKNGKFTTKFKSGSDIQIVGTGTYGIGDDGKTLNQKRDADDDGIDEPAEVIRVSASELSFKTDTLIFHFERSGD